MIKKLEQEVDKQRANLSNLHFHQFSNFGFLTVPLYTRWKKVSQRNYFKEYKNLVDSITTQYIATSMREGGRKREMVTLKVLTFSRTIITLK